MRTKLLTKTSFILLITLVFALATGCSGEDGRDGINGSNGTNGSNGQNTSGELYIYITGDITNAQAATKLQNEFGVNTKYIKIENTTQLTTINLAGVTELIYLTVRNNQSLTAISTPNLALLYEYFNIWETPITTLNLPQLTSGNVNLHSNTALTSVSLPKLEVGDLNLSGNTALTSVSLPKLEAGNVNFSSNTALTSVNLPLLKSFTSLYLSYNKLSVSSVNNILIPLSNITPALSGKTIFLQGQTPSASPTGQGLLAKGTLIANGNTVLTD